MLEQSHYLNTTVVMSDIMHVKAGSGVVGRHHRAATGMDLGSCLYYIGLGPLADSPLLVVGGGGVGVSLRARVRANLAFHCTGHSPRLPDASGQRPKNHYPAAHPRRATQSHQPRVCLHINSETRLIPDQSGGRPSLIPSGNQWSQGPHLTNLIPTHFFTAPPRTKP